MLDVSQNGFREVSPVFSTCCTFSTKDSGAYGLLRVGAG